MPEEVSPVRPVRMPAAVKFPSFAMENFVTSPASPPGEVLKSSLEPFNIA